MSESQTHSHVLLLPGEGNCLQVAVTAGAQVVFDCSAFHAVGAMVSLFNQTAGPMGYKFSASAVAAINIGATSGPTACSRLETNGSDRAFIPLGKPYLHLQGPFTGSVYIAKTSELR